MSGRRFRRAAAAAALGLGAVLGAVLGALAALYGEDAPIWSIPLLAAAVLILCELVSLSRGPAPDATVERSAVTAVLVGRLLVAALLAFAGATVALLAAAVPARHGLATGLLGTAAAAALFFLVAALARRGGEA
jgi:MFS family permease